MIQRTLLLDNKVNASCVTPNEAIAWLFYFCAEVIYIGYFTISNYGERKCMNEIITWSALGKQLKMLFVLLL